MGQIPYNSYHGRKRRLRSVLIGAVTALVILLAAVLAGYYFGFFNLPDVPATQAPVPSPAQVTEPAQTPVPPQEPDLVIEPPSAAPSPSPSAPAAQADLSGYTLRDLPASLGLVLAKSDALPQESRHGVLVDLTDFDLSQADPAFTESLAALPYAAAWLSADADADLAAQVAALGFDELVLAATVPATEEDSAALTQRYRDIKASLDKAGWKGRLGLDVDQGVFSAPGHEDLTSAIAQSFERLYFRKTLSSANKKTLTDGGFAATGRTIVTAIKNPADLGYAWAVLP